MNGVDERVQAVRELLHLFQYERLIYAGLTCMSVVFLLTIAVMTLVRSPNDASHVASVVAMFGSAGIVTYSTGQLLRMWSDALRMIQQRPEENGGGK